METSMKRLCKACGGVIRGRSDKQFCDDLCRNRHHNRMRKRPALSDRARQIQRVLISNHRILFSLLRGRKKCVVHRDELLRAGFVFEVFTHCAVGRMGDRSINCLDLAYKMIGEDRVVVFYSNGGLGIFK